VYKNSWDIFVLLPPSGSAFDLLALNFHLLVYRFYFLWWAGSFWVLSAVRNFKFILLFYPHYIARYFDSYCNFPLLSSSLSQAATSTVTNPHILFSTTLNHHHGCLFRPRRIQIPWPHSSSLSHSTSNSLAHLDSRSRVSGYGRTHRFGLLYTLGDRQGVQETKACERCCSWREEIKWRIEEGFVMGMMLVFYRRV